MTNTLTFQLAKTGLLIGVMVCLLAFWPLTASEKAFHATHESTLISQVPADRSSINTADAGSSIAPGGIDPGIDIPSSSDANSLSTQDESSIPEAITFPMTLTDAAGRDIVFSELPKRIIVIGRGPFMTLHTMYMFPEAGSVIVGYENRASTVKDFITLVNPVSADIVELGTNPSLEPIAALKPDLVIKKGDSLDAMGELLMKAGIPLFYMGLETPERFFNDVSNLGKILGNPGRSREIIDYFQSRLNLFSERVSHLSEADKPGILVLHYDGRGSHAAMRVAPENWMQTIQVEYTGGLPVWLSESLSPGGWSIVNFEQIAAWNPDIIYIIFPFSVNPETVLSELKTNSLWKRLKALETGNLRAFPSDIIGWDTPEPRWLLGMTWMAVNTHPALFADIDMNKEIDSFFTTLYRIDKSVIDTRIRPTITILGPDNP